MLAAVGSSGVRPAGDRPVSTVASMTEELRCGWSLQPPAEATASADDEGSVPAGVVAVLVAVDGNSARAWKCAAVHDLLVKRCTELR